MTFNVIIPAAGLATRLRPLTTNTSKAMVRVNGTPALEMILDEIFKYNPTKVVIVDGALPDIHNYVDNHKHKDRIGVITQTNPDGPYGAIKRGFDILGDFELPLLVWLGDTLIFDDLQYVIGTDSVLTKSVEDHSRWCMYNGKNFFNKPSENIENGQALVGLYSFSDGAAALDAFKAYGQTEISTGLDLYHIDTGYSFKSVEAKEWYDIGEMSSYFETSAKLLNRKGRVFNSFTYDPNLYTITKTSSEYSDSFDKISLEANWYRRLDQKQQLFTPRYIDGGINSVTLSYEPGVLISDLILHEQLPKTTIDYLIRLIFKTMEDNFWSVSHLDFMWEFKENSTEHWVTKSLSRIAEYDFTIEQQSFIEDRTRKAVELGQPISCMHGDLHGGNIIFNPLNGKLTLIDPRGSFGKWSKTNEGDLLYELAKLSHDFHHGYYAIVNDGLINVDVTDIFDTILIEKYGERYAQLVNDLGAILVGTCIPLHSDDYDRQARLYGAFSKHVQAFSY